MKTQVVVNKSDKKVICTSFANGKRHDFRVYKESKVHAKAETKIQGDTAFIGIKKLHTNSEVPFKRTKKNPLDAEKKSYNRKLSSSRVTVENVIGFLKRFKIISDRYRNRRKRFGLRFNLIAGICNFDVLA